MRGGLLGLAMNHTPAHVARAVLEGCAFALRDIVDRLDALGLGRGEVRIVGGGARDNLWATIKASVLGRPVRRVLTQEATYLCNRLNMQIEHQPSYPMIHLAMEDVWVWDKNRPTRIIPKADVHTTQDVTIEELKPEDSMETTLPADFVIPPETE